MIRYGDLDDLPACKAIAINCFTELDTYRNLTPEFEMLTQTMLKDPGYTLIVSEKGDGSINGFLIGRLHRGIHFSDVIASNIVFYVLPKARGMVPFRLAKEFEAWAKLNKAKQIHLSTSGGSNIERNLRFFSGLGYKLSGILAVKEAI